MSYLLNIKVNNLARDLNDLEDTVANLQIGGAPNIAGDLQMNDHSIQEINTLEFNSNHVLAVSNSDLTYDNGIVVTADNIDSYVSAFNPTATEDLNMGGHYVIDAGKITFLGSTYPLLVDNSNNVTWNGDVIVTSDNIGNYQKYTASQNLNMNGNAITNTTNVAFTDTTELRSANASAVTYTLNPSTTQNGNTFVVGGGNSGGFRSNQSIQYATVTASISIADPPLQTSYGIGFHTDASASNPLYGINLYPYTQVFQRLNNGNVDATIPFTALNADVRMQISGQTMRVFINDVEESTLEINLPTDVPYYLVFSGFFASYVTVSNLTFAETPTLLYDDSIVLTADNYATYIDFPADTGFVPLASADLDMATHDIDNVGTLSFSAGGTLSTDGADLILNTDTVLTSANYTNYLTSDTGFVPTADQNLNMSNHEINNVSSLDFGSNKVLSLDVNNNPCWSDTLIVTRPQYLPTFPLAESATVTLYNNSYTLPAVTIPNDKINFNGGSFRITLNVPQFEFETNDEYLISIGVKLHSTQANQYADGIMFQVKSDAFTITNNVAGYSTLSGTFDFNSTTSGNNVTINNMSSPVVPNPTDDYDVFVIFGVQSTDNDFNTSQFNLSLEILDADIYDNLDMGTFGISLNDKVLTNTDGALTFDGVTLLTTESTFDQIEFTDSSILTVSNSKLLYQSYPVSVGSQYDKRYYLPNQSITSSVPVTVLIPIQQGTSNFIKGTAIGTSFCVQFSAVVMITMSGTTATISDVSVLDLHASNPYDYFGDVAFNGIANSPNVNMVVSLQNTSGAIIENVTLKYKVLSCEF